MLRNFLHLFRHEWTNWMLHPAYGNRDYRICKVCGKNQERKM